MWNTRRARGLCGIALAVVLSVALTGCGKKAVMLPPNADFYVLDLSDSGKAEDQFERINQDVLRSLTRNSLGQPFEVDGEPAYGPTVTTFSFVGKNSRFLKTFQLQDYEKVNQLFDLVSEDTRAQNSWDKLTSTYQSILEPLLIAGGSSPFPQSLCLQKFDSSLKDYFSGTQTRQDLVEKLCQMATYTTEKYRGLVNYIAVEKSEHKTSDVFGAIEAVNNSVQSILRDNPAAKIRLTLATDGENYLSPNNALNTFSILSQGDACQQGQVLFEKLSAKSLRGIDVELPGIGALLGDKAEYAGEIDKFWRCFFALSK